MAAGCATIYSRRGSGPELIEDGRHGLLVEPDDPAEISKAIVRLLEDRELTDRLSRAGRARVENDFSVEALVARNESFYRDCIQRFRDGRDQNRDGLR